MMQKLKSANIFYSIDPIKGIDDEYHILYGTINKVNCKWYCGIHSSKVISDSYLGCGIKSNRNSDFLMTRIMSKRSPFVDAICKYKTISFARYNLLYFIDRQSLIEAESLIVDHEFINRKDIYNAMIGGHMPPSNSGIKNGNFGNKWSDEKRSNLSHYFKQNRDTKAGKNNRATACILLDIQTREITHFDTIGEAGLFLNLKPNTARTFVNKARLQKRKYLIIKQKDFDHLDVESMIVEAKSFSRWHK